MNSALRARRLGFVDRFGFTCVRFLRHGQPQRIRSWTETNELSHVRRRHRLRSAVSHRRARLLAGRQKRSNRGKGPREISFSMSSRCGAECPQRPRVAGPDRRQKGFAMGQHACAMLPVGCPAAARDHLQRDLAASPGAPRAGASDPSRALVSASYLRRRRGRDSRSFFRSLSVTYSPRRIPSRPRASARRSVAVATATGILDPTAKYVRKASRTSSERVRCSRFLALSTSATISSGSEMVKVCRDFMFMTLSYIVIHTIARPRSAPRAKGSLSKGRS